MHDTLIIHKDKKNGFGFFPKTINAKTANSITVKYGSRQSDTFLKIKSANKKGFEIAEADNDSISLAHKNSCTARGKVGKGVAQTIDTTNNQGIYNGDRIRKLTPTECFRLMDFDESFMNNIKKHNLENPKKQISDSQLYKQAGNSIVRKMFIILLEKLNIK